MRTKVLYFIYSSHVKSGGGHFYSLISISSSLEKQIDYRIFNLGKVFANPLKNNKRVSFIPFTRFNFLMKFMLLIRQVRDFQPEVIHAFDQNSLFLARAVQLFIKCRVIFTKCGGQNGSKFIPISDEQILFSKENLEHYTKYGKKGIRRHLIPNRVNNVNTDEAAIKKLREKYKLQNKTSLLRISRFNPYYDLTFRQSIALLKSVLVYDPNTVLLFIGQIQSKDYFESLVKDCEGLPVHFVTDETYTNQASRLLPIADIVIATGRGVMEASSHNLKVFCPVSNTNEPVLFDEHTADLLMATNFSERAVFRQEQQHFAKLSKDRLDSPSKSKYYFDKYFDLEPIKPVYMDIYNSAYRANFTLLNFLGHGLRFIRIL